MSPLIPSPISINDELSIPASELLFSSARSSGPGGQNVNKLETKVQLEFDVVSSPSLTSVQRHTLLDRLSSRLTSSGILRVVSQESRSQWTNRKHAVAKFVLILRKALKPIPVRRPTAPSRAARQKRLDAKKRRGETKRMRGKALE